MDHRSAWPAEQGGDCRGSVCSGEAATNVCWPAARASSVGACVGDVGPTRCGVVWRRELGCGQPWRLGGGARKGTMARSGTITLTFLAPNKSPAKSRMFSKLSR
jgi:hypothetical protein